MRYQNWDVLLFPEESKIPLQEFKTACQVIQDPEAHNLLPTVTCFVPALPIGASFRVSIHSWQNPEISRAIQNLAKSDCKVGFEARLLIDGQIAGITYFKCKGDLPYIIDMNIEMDKNGEFEKLKFPTFHRELLSQSYWNAGDDLGRIKLVIAEGFSREDMPFNRVKNIVSFSFQHAPIDLLEAASIAWPNASMWRQVSTMPPYFIQHLAPQYVMENSHSPRRAASAASVPTLPRPLSCDPFTEPVRTAFRRNE